jgi:hypothetical protein
MKNNTYNPFNVNNNIFVTFIITGFCFLLYANTLVNSFAYDDYGVIIENSFINNWTRDAGFFFNKSYFLRSGEASYRPVATLTYFVNFLIWKTNPLGYHLSNLFFHIISVTILFLLLNKIITNRHTSLIAALLFASHPILTEAVNCITFNEDILTTIFFTLSLFLYIKHKELKNPRFLFFSLLSFGLSLLSKEMAITLPLILVIYDLIFKPEKGRNKNNIHTMDIIKTNFSKYFWYFLLAFIYLVLRFDYLKNPFELNTPLGLQLYQRIIYLPFLLTNDILLILKPFPLTVDHVFHYTR